MGLHPLRTPVRSHQLRNAAPDRFVPRSRGVLRARHRSSGGGYDRGCARGAGALRRRVEANCRGWPRAHVEGAHRKSPRGPAGGRLRKCVPNVLGIVPAAGAAARLQPLAFSKEMLPVGSTIDERGIERPKAVSEFLVERMIYA